MKKYTTAGRNGRDKYQLWVGCALFLSWCSGEERAPTANKRTFTPMIIAASKLKASQDHSIDWVKL